MSAMTSSPSCITVPTPLGSIAAYPSPGKDVDPFKTVLLENPTHGAEGRTQLQGQENDSSLQVSV